MALEKLTKIDGGGISTTSDYRVGVITATKFVGPVEGSITATDASFSGNVSIAGTLTYEDVINVDSVGIITGKGADINGDLDVDGHTNLDNVSIAGVTTFSSNLDVNADIDVDGHTELDNLNVAGVSTFNDHVNLPTGDKIVFGNTNQTQGYLYFDGSTTRLQTNHGLNIGSPVCVFKSANLAETMVEAVHNGAVKLWYDYSTYSTPKLQTTATGVTIDGTAVAGALDISGDIDVDGHTNLDNVSIAGVATATTFVGALTGTASGNPTLANGANNRIITALGANELYGEPNLTWTGSYFATSAGAESWTMRGESGGPKSFIGFQNQYLANGYTVGCGVDDNKSFVVYTNGQNSGERLRIDQTGISTFYQNLFASKDFDVDGHTELDNVNVSGIATVGGFQVDHGSSSDQVIDIKTTATSGATRIRFMESGSDRAELTYSHDNDLLELIGMSGNGISIITNGYGNERVRIASGGDVTVNNTLNANTKLNVGATSVGFTPHTTSWATGAAVNLKGNYGGGITFNDNGNSGFSVYVDGGGNNFHIKNGAVGGSLEHSIRCVKDGTVELFHNGEAKILTKSNGATVQDLTATGAYLDITSSSGSNGKVYGVSGTTIGFLDNQNHWLMKGIKDGSVELNFDNLKKLSTNSTGIEIHANEGNNANIHMTADEGDDNGDQWLLQSQAATNNFNIYNDTSGSLALKLSLKTTGNLDLYGNLIIPDAIVHTGDTDTKIVFTDNQIDLQTGGSSRIYANNSAVYVKSGFPLAFLASSGPTPNIKSGGTNNQDLLFTTGSGNPTRMQINSAGSVGIGTASIATNKKLDVCDGIISVQGTGSHDSRIEFNRTNTGALGWIGIPNWHADGLYIYGPTSNSNEIASKYASGAWSFYTSGSSNSVKLHITADGNIGFNRTNVNAGDSQTQTMTATPSRIVFNNHYSNGYTDASLKLYLFNDGATRQGFTSGPIYDLQYHSSGHATYARHAFYTQNLERLRIEGTGNTDVKKGLRVSGEDAAWGSGSEGAFMDYYASGSMVRLGHVNGQSGSAKNIVFYTGGSEKVRITSGGILEIDRGSAINQAIDIKTTATSGASRIRFMQSGTQEAQMAFSHDNNQLEIIAHAGNDVVLFSNNTINQRIDTNGHITAPNNVAFCARGGPSDVTDAVVVFGTIVFQRGGTNYSTSTGEFTAPVSGIYHFMCNPYRYQDSVDSVLFLEKSTNGGSSWTQEIEIRAMNNYGGDNGRGWFSLPLSNLLEMNANDKARIKAVRRVHCNGTFSRFSGFLVA